MRTYLQVAVGLQQQVGRLQVSVQHVGRVDVLEAAQELVDEVLDVVDRKGLLAVDDAVQIRLHQVLQSKGGGDAGCGMRLAKHKFKEGHRIARRHRRGWVCIGAHLHDVHVIEVFCCRRWRDDVDDADHLTRDERGKGKR
jgi:hypothetical protein